MPLAKAGPEFPSKCQRKLLNQLLLIDGDHAASLAREAGINETIAQRQMKSLAKSGYAYADPHSPSNRITYYITRKGRDIMAFIEKWGIDV